MVCPKCQYVMDPFDAECRKCKGKGLESPTASTESESVVLARVAAPPVALTPGEEATMRALLAAPAPVPVLKPTTNRADDLLVHAARGTAPPPPTPQEAAAASALGGSSLAYFFTVRDSALGKPLLYRVYADTDALLFIEAGTWHIGLIDATKAMYGETGGDSAVGRVMLRAGGAGGLVGGLAVGGLMMLVGKNLDNKNQKVAQELDSLSPDALRQKARSGGSSLFLTRDSASQVVLRPSAKFSLTDSLDMAGYLTFVHQQSGKTSKWKLSMMTQTDSRFAAQELRRVLGPERAEIKFTF